MNVTGDYGGYSSQASSGIMFPGQPFINDVVADVASQYGRQGTEFVHKNVSTCIVSQMYLLLTSLER